VVVLMRSPSRHSLSGHCAVAVPALFRPCQGISCRENRT